MLELFRAGAAHETAKRATAAPNLGAKKIQELEEAIEDERSTRACAETALADLRVELASLTERVARNREPRVPIERFGRIVFRPSTRNSA